MGHCLLLEARAHRQGKQNAPQAALVQRVHTSYVMVISRVFCAHVGTKHKSDTFAPTKLIKNDLLSFRGDHNHYYY